MNQDAFEKALIIACDGYLARVDAGRQLMNLAADDKMAEPFTKQAAHLSPGQKKDYRETLTLFAEGLASMFEGDPAQREPRSLSFKVVGDRDVERAVTRAILRGAHLVRMPKRSELLRRSMLTLLASDFELLLSEVVPAVLLERPSLLNAAESSLSLQELEALPDVDSARQLIVQRKVDDLLREGIGQWSNWFDKFGVKWRDMIEDWPAFVEVFARRNVFMHAGGVVSPQYLKALRDAGARESEIPALGAKLELDQAYLEAASERLLAFGFLLCTGTWLQLRKEDSTTTLKWVLSRVDGLQEQDHPAAVEAICKRILTSSRGRLSRTIEVSLNIAHWVAQVELGRAINVRSEIEKWDNEGLDLQYAHAKSVLLEQDDRAVAEIGILIERGDLTVSDLVNQPLYRRLVNLRRSELLGYDSGQMELDLGAPAGSIGSEKSNAQEPPGVPPVAPTDEPPSDTGTP
jgi:hypothetical protein